MPFSSFVVGGGEKYQKIGRAKVELAVLNSDAAALLEETDSLNDSYEEHEQFTSTPRHRALAFGRKSVQNLDSNSYEEQEQFTSTPRHRALAFGRKSVQNLDSNSYEEQEQFTSTPRHRALAFARKSVQNLDSNMKLRIRKMDDTTFVVEVSKTATVLELKGAVQRRFEPTEAGGCQVSWPHVWGNFCLSFKDQKLLDESVLLHQVGIGESHELVFVRHLATKPSRRGQGRGFLDVLRLKLWLSN